MPYARTSDLPNRVKEHLPDHAQEIFREAFNQAYEPYHHDEVRAFRVAWSAVETKYVQDAGTGSWKLKPD